MKRYAIARDRWAYAKWCDRQGVKQDHAVYVRLPSQLPDMMDGETQFIFIDGFHENFQWTDICRAMQRLMRNTREAHRESAK